MKCTTLPHTESYIYYIKYIYYIQHDIYKVLGCSLWEWHLLGGNEEEGSLFKAIMMDLV